MRRLRPGRFSAILTSHGVHLARYRRGVRGLQVVSYRADAVREADPVAAAERLAALVEGSGGRGCALALAVSGYGTTHHLLTLPAAPREVLEPVVAREMRRFYPHLFGTDGGDPVIEFTESDSTGDPRHDQQQELLVAGLPRDFVGTLERVLASRSIRLEHLTVLPRVMQRIYEHEVADRTTTAALLMVPRVPLLGFFHERELRLFSELIPGDGRAGGSEAEGVRELVERGALFVRQQFRGTTVERLMVAVEPAGEAELTAELEQLPGMRVERFPVHGASPGALAALGAALDANDDHPFNLLPASMRGPTRAERAIRLVLVASAALLVAVSAWDAARSARAASAARERVEQLQATISAQAGTLERVQPVVRERQAHAHRALLLAALGAEKDRLPELLWAVRQAPPGIRLDDLSLTRDGEEWRGALTAHAVAGTSSEAARSVELLYQSLAASLPGGTVTLEQLGADAAATPADGVPGTPEGAVVLPFRLAFVAPLEAAP